MRRFVFFMLIVLLSFSCREREDSSIPDSEVYLKLSWDDYVRLRNPGTYQIFTTGNNVYPANTKLGYGGLVVFRDFDGNIRACDLSCPVEAMRSVRVEIDMPYAVCPRCESKFDLSFGFAAPCGGPATEPLYVYDHVVDNGSTIVGSN